MIASTSIDSPGKIPVMSSSRTYPFLLAALVAAGGSAGYLLGRPSPASTATSADSAPVAASAPGAKEGGEASSSKAVALAVMAKLKADDPTDRDTGKQLEAWEKIRAFTIEQCLEALDANGEKATAVFNNEAACMLYYRLGELDPELALKRARALPFPFSSHFTNPVLVAWFKKDPDAAYSWSLKLSMKSQEQLGIAEMMMATLMNLPPEERLRRTEGKDPQLRENIIVGIAELAAKDPARREAFLKTLEGWQGDDLYAGMKILLRTWGGQDPAAVLENWESFKFQDRPGGRPVQEEIIARWANRDPAGALGWMDEHPDKVEFPRQVEAFRKWVNKDQAAAEKWLEGRSEPELIASELVKQMHADSLRETMGHVYSDQAKQKLADELRGYYRIWSKANPDQAAEWISGIDAGSAAKLKDPTDESR